MAPTSAPNMNAMSANIHIPGSVTIIGKLAFAECRSLCEVSVAGSVQTLGHHAFRYCDALERLLVDEGALIIGHGAFAGCRSLSDIWICESLARNVEGAFERDALPNTTLFRDNVCGLAQRPSRFGIVYLSIASFSELVHR